MSVGGPESEADIRETRMSAFCQQASISACVLIWGSVICEGCWHACSNIVSVLDNPDRMLKQGLHTDQRGTGQWSRVCT